MMMFLLVVFFQLYTIIAFLTSVSHARAEIESAVGGAQAQTDIRTDRETDRHADRRTDGQTLM